LNGAFALSSKLLRGLHHSGRLRAPLFIDLEMFLLFYLRHLNLMYWRDLHLQNDANRR
jgi:hypothetical protein